MIFMIISYNAKPRLDEFKLLMADTDKWLNLQASKQEDYYLTLNGRKLENVVCEALCHCAKQTAFENSIQLVSGAKFPDIIAQKYYGVEVKSTKKNHWTSIGSSILESTRVQDVERIFMTFGKLSKPVSFLSRPYEEVLSGISVTHYPRYQINMKLGIGETIFDKIGVTYDKLSKMDNPVSIVSEYYRSKLQPGQSLWWASDNAVEESAAPMTVRLWSTLSQEERIFYTLQGYCFFPEIMTGSSSKYQRYALWLAIEQGIVNTNIRDQFSAGGKRNIICDNSMCYKVSAVIYRIHTYKNLIIDTILNADEYMLKEGWGSDKIHSDRIMQWIEIIGKFTNQAIYRILKDIFNR